MPQGRKKNKGKTTIYPAQEILDKLDIIAGIEGVSRNVIIEKFLQKQVQNYDKLELVEEIKEIQEEEDVDVQDYV